MAQNYASIDDFLKDSTQEAAPASEATPSPAPQESSDYSSIDDFISNFDSVKTKPAKEASPTPIKNGKIEPTVSNVNADGTIKNGVNITPTYTKTQKAKAYGKLAENSFLSGLYALPKNVVVDGTKGIVSLANELGTYFDKNLYSFDPNTRAKAYANTADRDKYVETINKGLDKLGEKTGLMALEHMGQDYQDTEDAKIPEDLQKSLGGQISAGVGGSIPFLASLALTRGAGVGAEAAGIESKAGIILNRISQISEKLGVPFNTLAESGQLREQTEQDLINQGHSKEAAKEGADHVFTVSLLATPALDKVGLFSPKVKNTIIRKFAQFGIDLGSEVAQENVQQSAQNVAEGKNIFEGAKNTSLVAGVTSAIFSLISHGHISIKGDQAEPSTNPEDAITNPTVGDIVSNNELPKDKQIDYSDEQKQKALAKANLDDNLVDSGNEHAPDTKEYQALKTDITEAVNQGIDPTQVMTHLVDTLGVSSDYASSIVNDAVQRTNESKYKESLTGEVDNLNKDQEKIAKGLKEAGVKQPDGSIKIPDENAPKAKAKLATPKEQAQSEIQSYLDASPDSRNNFVPSVLSTETNKIGKQENFPSFIPESLRSQKLISEVKTYWQNQQRPVKKGKLQQLYDTLVEHTNQKETDHTNKMDEEMSKNEELIKDETKPVTKEQQVLEDFKKRYKVDFPVHMFSKIFTGAKAKESFQDGLAEGVTDEGAIGLAYDAIVDTSWHELVHLTLSNLETIPEFSKFSREDILKAQAEKMGVEYNEKNDKQIEEQLALDMEGYQNGTYKPKNTLLRQFFAYISNAVKNIKKVLLNSKGDVIRDFYNAIRYDESSRKNTITLGERSKIARYVIDDVLDYRKKAGEKRVISLSNGLTSVDFKSATTAYDPTKISAAISNSLMNKSEGKYGKNERFTGASYSYKEAQTGKAENGKNLKGRIVIGQDDNSNIILKDGTHLLEAYRDLDIPVPKDKLTFEDGVTLQYLIQKEDQPREDNGRFAPKEPSFKEAVDHASDIYDESRTLTTKILKDLEGKKSVSKQYIMDATNRSDVKQVEKDLIRSVASQFGSIVNVKEFEKEVMAQLLPLSINGTGRVYQEIVLPESIRGEVDNYDSRVYESPIETSAGNIHFNGVGSGKRISKYFGHTRIEDMREENTRRVIEVQSDLYQKGRLEQELDKNATGGLKGNLEYLKKQLADPSNSPKLKKYYQNQVDSMEERQKEFSKLSQYNDPTAHFRMIREEIRQAAIDSKKTVLFPTGETAMKVEGLGSPDNFMVKVNSNGDTKNLTKDVLDAGNVGVGSEIVGGGDSWIITEVLGDGKFKAAPKDRVDSAMEQGAMFGFKGEETKEKIMERMNFNYSETFDVSGDVDKNNPIYKFYEKEVGKYLKNNYQAEPFTDDKGVTWMKVTTKPEYKGQVLAFKEKVAPEKNEEDIKRLFPRYYALTRNAKIQKPSRAYSRVKSRLDKQLEHDVNYTPTKIENEIAKAQQFYSQDKNRAARVALGLEEPPLDITKTAIQMTVSENAKEAGNYELQADVEQQLSLDATRSGQEISMLQDRYNEDSAEFFVQKILKQRELLAQRDYAPLFGKGKKFTEMLNETVSKRRKKAEKKLKEDLTYKEEDLNDYLNALAC